MRESTPANPPHAFSWPVRVYWEDTDAGGVVYHASYLRFIERARTEWMRACGFEQERLRIDHAALFVVREMGIQYLKPARLDDLLDATAAIRELRPASVIFNQTLLRAADRVVLLEARVRVACIDPSDFRPRAIPAQCLRMFKETDLR